MPGRGFADEAPPDGICWKIGSGWGARLDGAAVEHVGTLIEAALIEEASSPLKKSSRVGCVVGNVPGQRGQSSLLNLSAGGPDIYRPAWESPKRTADA